MWRQADRYQVPRLVYLNKMDKSSASLDLCLNSIRSKLHAVPIPIHLPLGHGKEFKGVVDLITMQKLEWDLGSRLGSFTCHDIHLC